MSVISHDNRGAYDMLISSFFYSSKLTIQKVKKAGRIYIMLDYRIILFNLERRFLERFLRQNIFKL